MREVVNQERARQVLRDLGREFRHEAKVFLVGGASAVVCGWRDSTIDVDLKIAPDVEAFSAIARIKDRARISIELASPHDFLPTLPGWEERSEFIAREGKVSFFHFDFYSQALAKIERGFQRDVDDVHEMVQRGLVEPSKALELFERIVPELNRFPAIDPAAFRSAVTGFFGERQARDH